MADKVRSKSIGRNPSKTFKSLDAFKARVLKNSGKEYLNVESDDEEQILQKQDSAVVDSKLEKVLDKMSTLGELTSEIHKNKIDGDNLDRIFKDLFKQYNDEKETRDIASERFLMLNTCRNSKDLTPPPGLKKSIKKLDLDKITKLQRIFSNIPIFTNEFCG